MALLVMKTYCRVLVGRHLFYMFPDQNSLKKIRCCIAMDFQLCCTVRHWECKIECLKLNGTHQLQLHVDDNNILGGILHTIKGKRSFSSC